MLLIQGILILVAIVMAMHFLRENDPSRVVASLALLCFGILWAALRWRRVNKAPCKACGSKDDVQNVFMAREFRGDHWILPGVPLNRRTLDRHSTRLCRQCRTDLSHLIPPWGWR